MSRVKKLLILLVNEGAGLWQLGDEIAVLRGLHGEQTGGFISCVGM